MGLDLGRALVAGVLVAGVVERALGIDDELYGHREERLRRSQGFGWQSHDQ